MQVVFEDYFSMILPRTTLEQMQFGKPVAKRRITPGDMVFFKTGRRTYHVGIMVNSTEFLHASTSEGVTISDLSHPYWESSLLAFRRVL
jgi:cell wall-associated NlpC family hydrolase